MLKKYLFHPLWTILLLSSIAFSQTTISGLAYADYYYNLKNHSAAEIDRNAFTFRRIYLTLENNINPDIKIRLRLESAHDKYGYPSKINPFVKHAFLEWSNLIPRHKLYLGISATNTFNNSEHYWGYRSIEKTIMDLNKISPSADMGIALKGNLIGEVLHHWLMVSNGTGYGSSEVDRYKKVGYALWLTPVKGLIIEGVADYENQNPNDLQTENKYKYKQDYTGNSACYTIKGFIGYKQYPFTIGAETFIQTQKESGIQNVVIENDEIISSTISDVNIFGYSVFGSIITPIRKLKVFIRYDFFDPNTEDNVYIESSGYLISGTNDENSLIIAGLDYIPKKNIHIMPNIIIKSYAEGGKNTDITGRITLYYQFDSENIKTN